MMVVILVRPGSVVVESRPDDVIEGWPRDWGITYKGYIVGDH